MYINKDTFLLELKKRNPLAIEFIVKEYGSVIRSSIGKYLSDNESALDECFNDVLLAVWKNPAKFDDKKSDFKNWICAIAKYRAIDTLRREIKHQEKFININSEQCIDWLNKFHVSENGVDLFDSSVEELTKLLECLSEDDKDLFFRRYIQDQTVDEIANEKSMSRGQIYTRISMGKKKVQNYIKFRQEGITNE